MARLPMQGGDDGTWGDILNDFLAQEHNADGSQKDLPQSKITNLTSDLASKASTSDLAAKVDKTTTVNGQPLSGNVSLTAADVSAVPTTRQVNGQALSSDITLSKSDIGLSNVDNTSDASKPISTATQGALDSINGQLTTAQGNIATLQQTADIRTSGYSAHNLVALRAFRAALGGRLTTPCNILVMGDSTDEGTGVGTTASDRNKSWPDRLAVLLRQRFPTIGETVDAVANFLPVNTTSTVPTGVVKSANWTASTNYGANANAARSSTAGDTLTFSLAAGVTAFEVVSLGGGSISGYTVSIDGGAASATQGLGGSIRDGYVSSRFTVSASTSHSVVVTTVGTNNYIHGLLVYSGNESKGIRVFNGAKHGSRAENYRNGGSYNWLPASPSPTTLGGVQSAIALNPDLLVVGWGINDYTSTSPDVTAANYRSYLEQIVAGVRAMLPSKIIPVLIVGKWKVNAAQGGQGTWQEFRQARLDMAAADPLAAVIEIDDLMPDIGSSEGTTLGLYSDTLHATSKGYQMAADTIASFIES